MIEALRISFEAMRSITNIYAAEYIIEFVMSSVATCTAGLFMYFYLDISAMDNKILIANNYKLFADRWKQEDAKTHKRRGCMIIILCITNLILFPVCYVLLKKYHII